MTQSMVRIAVVAPANPLAREAADRVAALASQKFPGEVDLFFHPQCFHTAGHFAGTDAERSAAFLEVANDPSFSAVWFARGGYGSCRLDDALFAALNGSARDKVYLGYSDLGTILARLYKDRIGRPAHGPMATDINRRGGEAAVLRALAFLARGDRAGIEPHARNGVKTLAFNIATLSSLIGTPAEPDFSGHVLMLEDVSEQMYRIDRMLFQLTANANIRRAAGVRLGRINDIIPNAPDFGLGEEDMIRGWCERSGIAYLGRCDIGHDADNKIVPFGGLAAFA